MVERPLEDVGDNIPFDFYMENRIIRWEVDAHLIRDWFGTLDEDTQLNVAAAIDLLAEEGPNLKRPFVGAIEGSRFRNMKELRPSSSGASEIRILFAFDPVRRAILLLGGDKRGRWSKWYKEAIPVADRLYQEHLDALERS